MKATDMKKENVIQEKSFQFALRIIQTVRQFPKRTDGYTLGRQLLRSGTSIGANVEEAIPAYSKDDFIYKMNIALKEARETKYWLRLCVDSKLSDQDMKSRIAEADELIRILTSIVKTAQKKAHS